MKRVSNVLLGLIALLVLPGTLLAAGDELAGGRAGAITSPLEETISLPTGFYHTLPGNPHPAGAAWTPDPANEVIEDRTETMKVYRDPANPLRRTAVIAAAPVHYQAADGTWVDIDTNLKAKAGVLAAVANSFQTFFQEKMRADYLVEVAHHGHWVRSGAGLDLSLELNGTSRRIAARADGTRARIVGDRAVYTGALGGDVVLRSARMRVEQHLLLPSAPTELIEGPQGSLVLRETLTFSEGLVPYLDTLPVDGTPRTGRDLVLVEASTQTSYFEFDTPTAYETDALAESHGFDTHVGDFRVSREGNTLVVEKVFAGDWFLDPARVYPVTLDPTFQPTVRPVNETWRTGFVYRCGGCTGGEYERIYTYGSGDYGAYGDRLRVYTSGASYQMKDWLAFDISALKRYITVVNWARLDIFLDGLAAWPANHGSMNFNDVNLNVCDYDGSTGYGQTLYNAIDTGTNFLSSALGGDCGPGASGADCIAPHWHYIDLCGSAPTIIKNNRAANLGYFNVGMELTSETLGQDLRFQDRQNTNYPRVIIDYTSECDTNGNCNDNNACTQNICNNGRCEYPYEPTMCYISGVCYNQNYVNPANQCQKCWPGSQAGGNYTAWTNDNALACSDGNACTWQDHCVSGACQATPYTCNDGKTCTTDICNGNGTCTYDINTNWCLINGTCYGRFTVNPSAPCQECRDDWGLFYETNWGYDNSHTCNDNDACTYNDHCSVGACESTSYSCNDGKTCTQDICNGDNTCTHNILATTCYIAGTCYSDEQTSPFNDCKKCDADATQTAWTNWAANHACADEGFNCTTDICDGAGTCTHPINNGRCLISNVCYSDGDDKPGDACHECNSTLTKTAWSNVANNTVSRPCYSGWCTGGAHGIGTCRNGIQWCVNGSWNNCAGMICPVTDTCDYLDNDCDGNTDEDYAQVRNGLVTACDGDDYDECIGGSYTCRENGTGVECINDGAIAFFMFEEGTGNQVNTSSGIVTTQFKAPPRVGILSGATWTASGHPDGSGVATKALIFDGVNDYVDVEHHTTMDLTTAMSMEAWIYPTAATGEWRVIGGLYNGTNAGYYMAVNFTQGPGFAAWFGPSCGWKYSNQLPLLNSWTHVAVTYDGALAKLYVDGAKVHESACNGNGGSLAASTSPLHIGGLGAYNPTQAPFAGAIDDFGIYKTTLTEAQIKARARHGDHCDGADNDCNGLTDENLYPDPLERRADPLLKGWWRHKNDVCDGQDADWCIHGTYTCSPSGLTIQCTNEDPEEIPEICDGLDNDCNTVLPVDEYDEDNDTWMVCENDCDDHSVIFSPSAPEICDGFDNNCDSVLLVAEQDLDGDNHLACVGVVGEDNDPLHWADCDDLDDRIHKDYPEVCDTLDNDCDGLTDDDDPNFLVPKIDSYEPIGVGAGDDRPSEPDFGPQTYTITLRGKNFVDDVVVSSIDFGYGITVNSLTVHSTTLMTASITVDVETDANSDELIGSRDIVIDIGNCQVVLAQGFDVFGKDAIPTLTEWGIIALSTLLLGFGIVAIRRRRMGHFVA